MILKNIVMTIRKRDFMLSGLEMDQLAKIKVIGIGGGGGNAISTKKF